jgi:hypothetical protein
MLIKLFIENLLRLYKEWRYHDEADYVGENLLRRIRYVSYNVKEY